MFYFMTSQFLRGIKPFLAQLGPSCSAFFLFSAMTKNQSAAMPHLLTAIQHRATEVSIYTMQLHITHTPGSQTEPFRDIHRKSTTQLTCCQIPWQRWTKILIGTEWCGVRHGNVRVTKGLPFRPAIPAPATHSGSSWMLVVWVSLHIKFDPEIIFPLNNALHKKKCIYI